MKQNLKFQSSCGGLLTIRMIFTIFHICTKNAAFPFHHGFSARWSAATTASASASRIYTTQRKMEDLKKFDEKWRAATTRRRIGGITHVFYTHQLWRRKM